MWPTTPGRSLFVRLRGPESGKGAAGKWTDAATGEHGDLLDIIRETCGLSEFRDVLDEARSFLRLPRTEPPERQTPAPQGSPESARRLFAMAEPIRGTLAETYLRSRGITDLRGTGALRFHPRCYYRADEHAPLETWPALLAAVTDLDGTITGVQRTWLARDGSDKAPLATPRRAMGHLLGNGVRFGAVIDVMAAGEGIETMLSLRCALPALPMVAALSANHLAALELPPALRRLYIARDAGEPGLIAAQTLGERAQDAGVEALTLTPTVDDFNRDLRTLRPRGAQGRASTAARAGGRRAIPASRPRLSMTGSGGRSAARVTSSSRGKVRARPSRGRSGRKQEGPATAPPRLSSPGGFAALPRGTRKPRLRRPPLPLRPYGCGPFLLPAG